MAKSYKTHDPLDQPYHSPININAHLAEIIETVGGLALRKERKYQQVRESRIAMVIALVLFKTNEEPWYIHMPGRDPPDAILRHWNKENPANHILLNLEITSWKPTTKTTLLDVLKKKVPPYEQKNQKYDSRYVLVFEIIGEKGADWNQHLLSAHDYLKKVIPPFPIWLLVFKKIKPNTIVEIICLNPELQTTEIDVGEILYKFSQKELPPVIFPKKKRKDATVGLSKIPQQFDAPPWKIK